MATINGLRSLKAALGAGVAATALLLGAGAHADTSDDVAKAPTYVVAEVQADVAPTPSDETVASPAAPRLIFIGGLLAALGALLRLIGPKKVVETVSAGVKVAASAAKGAAEATVKAVRSPFRAVAIFGGVVVFALTGIAIFDLEWIAGIATGLVGGILAAFGGARVRTATANFFKNFKSFFVVNRI